MKSHYPYVDELFNDCMSKRDAACDQLKYRELVIIYTLKKNEYTGSFYDISYLHEDNLCTKRNKKNRPYVSSSSPARRQLIIRRIEAILNASTPYCQPNPLLSKPTH